MSTPTLKDPSEIRAWMGYAPGHNGGFAVRVCAWCTDRHEAEAIAKTGGMAVTHGICEKCSAVFLGEQIPLPITIQPTRTTTTHKAQIP